jgi:hypothetical protein
MAMFDDMHEGTRTGASRDRRKRMEVEEDARIYDTAGQQRDRLLVVWLW